MKRVQDVINNRDTKALQSMMPSAPQASGRLHDASLLFNELFRQLGGIFPAAIASTKSQHDLDEFRRQWMLALAENQIYTLEQINAGLKVARQQDKPYLPSPGQFVSWCKAGAAQAMGLPSIDDVMSEFSKYNGNCDRYESPELFPWSHPVMYWVVLDMRKAMYQYNQTITETEKTAKNLLSKWAKKLATGGIIPTPVVQITDKTKSMSLSEQLDKTGQYREVGREFLDRILKAKKGAA